MLMSKLYFVGDLHFSEDYNLTRDEGTLNGRLSNMLEIINWIDDTANGQPVFQLGDFFDKSELSGNEALALSAIMPKIMKWRILLGNHEIDSNGYLSAIINAKHSPGYEKITDSGLYTYYLPFSNDNEYTIDHTKAPEDAKRIITLSHNVVRGHRSFSMRSGLTVDDNIPVINGHLHNPEWLGENFLNIGNATGLNFSESTQKHYIFELDVEDFIQTGNLHKSGRLIEIPMAVTYHKQIANTIDTVKDIITELSSKEDGLSRRCIHIGTPPDIFEETKELLSSCRLLRAYRVYQSKKEPAAVEAKAVPQLDAMETLLTFFDDEESIRLLKENL